MNTQNDDVEISRMRKALQDSVLSVGTWALGELQDERACLLRDSGEWVAGYSERGNFYEKFREDDFVTALDEFVEWVEASTASTKASSEATAEWLKRTGRSRP